jgi:potassium efflux system protein
MRYGYLCRTLLIAASAICSLAWPLHSQVLPRLVPPLSVPAAQPTPSSIPSPSPVVQAVPLPQIAEQAEELDRALREMSKSLESAPETKVSGPEAEAQAADLLQRAHQAEELLDSLPNIVQIQNEERYWHAVEQEHGDKRKVLSARAAHIEEKIRWLEDENARWQVTAETVKGKSGLETVEQRIRQETENISKLQTQARQQLSVVLTLQNTISEQDREIALVMRKLDEAHERLRARLFERDSPPLWGAREMHASDVPVGMMLITSADRGFTGAQNFLRASKGRLIATALLYLFSLFIALRLKKNVVEETGRDVTITGSRIFARPLSMAVLLTLPATIGITASAPAGVSFIVGMFYLIPVLRLLPSLITPALRMPLYALCAFYLLEWAHLLLQFRVTFKRELLVLMLLIALMVFGWLLRPSRLKLKSEPVWRNRFQSAAIHIGLVLLGTSAVANILGFVSLAQILAVGTLFSAFTFALLATAVMGLHLGVVIVVNSMWFQSLPEGHGEVIERWSRRLLVLFATLLWVNVDLYLFTVRSTVIGALQEVLEYPIGYGRVHVTLGGILTIVFLLLLGYIIANIASFILGKILLPKVSLRGGMAYAISRVTYYILLTGLFFIVLANTGLQLDKFTVITGALGVGLGFGLQNIVSNFASGLIVLFERPIRVNDTVEIAGITGIVRRIGARSSTVLTAQGAEVIFPNSNLLSNQVTNWTLSSTRRRVEVSVGVSYSSDPEVVLQLLIDIANKNSRVLAHPPAQASFVGFGENALNFELTFWAAQAVWWELKSEIGLSVLRALRQAGIEIPYPQRELHLRSLDSHVEKHSPDPDSQSIKKPVPIR